MSRRAFVERWSRDAWIMEPGPLMVPPAAFLDAPLRMAPLAAVARPGRATLARRAVLGQGVTDA